MPREADQWRQSHIGFITTRYRLRPIHIEATADRAESRFAADVTLTRSENADAVTVPGEYAIGLEQTNQSWKVRSIRHQQERPARE